MLFSIVTPTYNYGRFLAAHIRSIIEQNKGVRVQHIIVDNMSADETPSLIERYASSAIDVIYVREPDRGQTNALNKGLSLATGDILSWLNADECLRPGALLKVQHAFETHNAADVIFGNSDFVSESGEVISRKREFGFSSKMLLEYGCYIPSCACFFKREVFRQSGGLDESYKVSMDYDWYIRLNRLGVNICHLPETLATFTWHDSNVSVLLSERADSERIRTIEANLEPSFYRNLLLYFPRLYRWKWQLYRNARRIVRLSRL